MIKIKPTIQLCTNKLTPTMNFSSLQLKPFRLWYKQNKKQTTNHTLCNKSHTTKTVIKTLLHHCSIKFGPPIYLVTDRGSEYINKEMAHLCTLMGIRHSPRKAYSPCTKGLVEVQNRNLGTHLRMFLHDTPKDWAFQVHMYAYAHNSQTLSELNISPREIVFHTRPRIPLTFD